ncbi:hypothetical protein L7F22_068158 [Adiantum nelumboides]|nr:hypothetical protein [Adiantum nelumboides]
MLVVTLTGGIASGKSTTSRLLSGAPYNIPLIDLDVLAREVVEPNDASKTLKKLVDHFGAEAILNQDGTLNRAALGRLIFGKEQEKNRKVANKFIHSAVRKRTAWLVIKYWLKGTPVVIIDTPLAVEAGLWKFCGEMILVFCSFEEQLERMLKRDGDKGLTKEDAENRLSSQLALEKKIPYADIVLDNATNAKSSLEEQVKQVVKRWEVQHNRGLGKVKTVLQWLVPPVGLIMALYATWARSSRVSKRLREEKKKDRSQ